MADTKHAVGVYTDSVDPTLGTLQPTYANIASQLLLTNRNGGSLVTGDVAVLSTVNTESAIQAASTGPYRPAFVIPKDIDLEGLEASKTVLDTAAGWMNKPGSFVPDAAVDGAVDIGEYLAYSATAKKFTGTNAFTCRPATAQAIALASTAVAANIPVLLLSPSPQLCRRARVTNSIDQSTTAGVTYHVLFNTEIYDVGGLHSTVANTGRLTIPAGTPTATYDVTASISFAAAGTNHLFIIPNAGADAYVQTATDVHCNCSAQLRLAAGDYVVLDVFTTAIATIKYYANYSPIFTITQIGE